MANQNVFDTLNLSVDQSLSPEHTIEFGGLFSHSHGWLGAVTCFSASIEVDQYITQDCEGKNTETQN